MKKVTALLATFMLLSAVSDPVISKETTININNSKLYNHETVKKEAEAAYKARDYKKAVFYLEKVLAKEPGNDTFRIKYAVSLVMSNNIKKGKKELQFLVLNSADEDIVSGSEIILSQLAEYEKKQKNMPNGRQVSLNKETVIEIDSSKSDDYLCNGADPTILEGGSFLRWETEDFPLKVFVPSPPKELKLKDPQKYVKIVRQAMLKWTAANPDIKFSFINNQQEANIVIRWHDYFTDSSMWGYAYLPVYNEKTGRRETSVNLAVRAQPGTAQFTNEAVHFSEAELSAIVTHETGHAIGLGHSYSRDDIMTTAFHSVFPDYEWKISPRDTITLKKLYSFPADARCLCK